MASKKEDTAMVQAKRRYAEREKGLTITYSINIIMIAPAATRMEIKTRLKFLRMMIGDRGRASWSPLEIPK